MNQLWVLSSKSMKYSWGRQGADRRTSTCALGHTTPIGREARPLLLSCRGLLWVLALRSRPARMIVLDCSSHPPGLRPAPPEGRRPGSPLQDHRGVLHGLPNRAIDGRRAAIRRPPEAPPDYRATVTEELRLRPDETPEGRNVRTTPRPCCTHTGGTGTEVSL